jgi:CheY-like chemotaxis protein
MLKKEEVRNSALQHDVPLEFLLKMNNPTIMLAKESTVYHYDHNYNNENIDDYFYHTTATSQSEYRSILLLDDEADIVNPIKHFLKSHGFSVNVFTEPLVALDDFQNNFESYSLVVSDINLKSTVTGFEFAKLVRQIHPTIKIFLMSATDINNPQYVRLAAKVKADVLLQKPFFLTNMLHVIENHL